MHLSQKSSAKIFVNFQFFFSTLMEVANLLFFQNFNFLIISYYLNNFPKVKYSFGFEYFYQNKQYNLLPIFYILYDCNSLSL